MAYFLVMGGLVLSAAFTLGWALWRTLRGLIDLVGGGSPKAAKGKGRAAPRKAAQRTSRTKKPAAPRKAPSRPAPKPPREPGRLSRWLAGWQAALPLALVASLTYLVARLAQYGLTFRPPHDAPGGFHELVTGLGWLAGGFIGLAVINGLARWRCRLSG